MNNTFKIRCIDDAGSCHTLGKIYQVTDGHFGSDAVEDYGSGHNSLFDINKRYISQFELVEEEPSTSTYRIRCINARGGSHKQGEIYDVVNGILKDKHGNSYPRQCPTVEAVNMYLNSQFELVEEPVVMNKSDMNKSDMKNGMIVETRAGKRYMWLNGYCVDRDGRFGDISETLEDAHGRERFDSFTIVRVFELTGEPTGLEDLMDTETSTCLTLIWERASSKEMAMAIDELLELARETLNVKVVLKKEKA